MNELEFALTTTEQRLLSEVIAPLERIITDEVQAVIGCAKVDMVSDSEIFWLEARLNQIIQDSIHATVKCQKAIARATFGEVPTGQLER